MLATQACPSDAGSAGGGSCRADQLYDPSVPLYRSIFKRRPEVFPSQDFSTPEWLEVCSIYHPPSVTLSSVYRPHLAKLQSCLDKRCLAYPVLSSSCDIRCSRAFLLCSCKAGRPEEGPQPGRLEAHAEEVEIWNLADMEQSEALLIDRILTERYALQLLRLLGLKKDLNQSAFKACAEEVETWDLAYMGAEERSEALAAARQLVAELASNPALQGTSLYSSVRDIAFVPASLVRTDALACLVCF